ncbi:MAG: N-acetylmuramoyl-L-alanine amidase [Pleurocapsa sp.]
MKFAIDIGHNAPPKDTGAVGIKREDNLCKEVGEKLISLLEKAGHLVVRTAPLHGITVNNSLKHHCEVANFSQADLFVSIHFNAANYRAYGSEVYALSTAGAAIGKSILTEICKLGFFNRGVKRANFYVLKRTTMPAVLVECCFCDSQKDMAMFKADSMALAIAKGLIGDLPSLPDELRTLRIKENTWLKETTEQAKDLKDGQKTWLTR